MKIKLLDLQPGRFYISGNKLRKVRERFDPEDLSNFDPLPVRELSGKMILTDGHTGALAAHLAGLSELPVTFDENEDPDMEA